MSRTPSGREIVDRAKACLKQARTVEELRQAQAVLLPLESGLSLAQVAEVLGISVGWVCRLRRRFVLEGKLNAPSRSVSCGGRRRQNMTPEQECAVLAPFLDRARSGGILVVGQIKAELENTLGRPMALSSVYNLLHRHGWRKLAPDKRHPKSDPEAQEEWKKNFPNDSPTC
jgi:transposase